MKKNILVTGGRGFVGSHIVDRLLRDGHNVAVVDDNRAHVNFLSGVGLLANSTQSLESLKALPMMFDVVVHAAAHADIRRNWDSREERNALWASNVEGTRRLLEATHGSHVIFLSTSAIYSVIGHTEEYEAQEPRSPYAASKLAGEALVAAYSYKVDRNWHILRPGAIVGARYHHGHIADMMASKLAGRTHEGIGTGMGKKSYVHVDDVVSAVQLFIGAPQTPRGIYNIASGVWSPRDTQRVLDIPTTWQAYAQGPGWTGDVDAVVAAGKLRSVGWSPLGSIENGVKEAAAQLTARHSAAESLQTGAGLGLV